MIPAFMMAALPNYVKVIAVAAAAGAIWLLGDLHGTRVEGEKHVAYVAKEALASMKITQAQAKVITVTQVEVQTKIQKVYVQGEKIETVVHDLIVPGDDAVFRVNAGFVRIANAAWSGVPPGPATSADREPAAVPLSAVGDTEVHNATSCRAWREQALGWRQFYARQQEVINGAEPDWAKEPQSESRLD